MESFFKLPDKGDPSNVLQVFPQYDLQLHCCRYWWLEKWEFKELSFPYWRIYHNNKEGASIQYNGKEFALSPDKILMIAPNTSYASRLYENIIPKTGFALEGGRVSVNQLEEKQTSINSILHLFIHFNMGMPYDTINPGVFVFELNSNLQEKLTIIKEYLSYEHTRFTFYCSLTILSLISDLLSALPESCWELITKNHRILSILSYIENNLSNSLTNVVLAKKATLATNAFARLFREEIGISPQKYVRKKRIDKACVTLHHSNISIDDVASQTGFADRYHFSRIFKKVVGVSPAKYKKEFGMK